MGNIMTEAMLKATKMMVKANEKLGKMGEMPYGKRKATPAERKIMKVVDEVMNPKEGL